MARRGTSDRFGTTQRGNGVTSNAAASGHSGMTLDSPELQSRVLAEFIEDLRRTIRRYFVREASAVVDGIQSEIAEVIGQIRPSGRVGSSRECIAALQTFKENAIRSLEAISGMALALMQAHLEKAEIEMQRRFLHGFAMLQESWENQEQLAYQMQMITKDTEQFAQHAVELASQECHSYASRQQDLALDAIRPPGLTDRCPQRAWTALQGEKAPPSEAGLAGWPPRDIPHDPNPWPKSIASQFALNNVNKTAVELQAVGNDSRIIPNVVDVDENIGARARTCSLGGGGGTSGDNVADEQSRLGGCAHVALNLGSRGHPDFCTRPCLYFAQGACSNGVNCSFCHMPHPKRPVRLDKVHREALKVMSFKELAELAIPILKQKVQGHNFPHEVVQHLANLWDALELQAAQSALDFNPATTSTAGINGDIASTGDAASIPPISTPASTASTSGSVFSGAFQAMSFRGLLATLTSKMPAEAQTVQEKLELVLQQVHETQTLDVSESGTLGCEMPDPAQMLLILDVPSAHRKVQSARSTEHPAQSVVLQIADRHQADQVRQKPRDSGKEQRRHQNRYAPAEIGGSMQ